MNFIILGRVLISYFIIGLLCWSPLWAGMRKLTVDSIAGLLSTLDQDNVEVLMQPGLYKVTVEDLKSELITAPRIFDFQGQEAVYDFTGVVLEVDSKIMRSIKDRGATDLFISGRGIKIQNLTLINTGNERPHISGCCVVIDGSDNVLENCLFAVRGSQPYAYGDLFGKGSKYVLKHWKRSALLIRGDRVHIKNCRIHQRAYGHGIFCQGAQGTIIEGCYVEGEVRTTDSVLKERNTEAAKIDFSSIWGYRVPEGFVYSLQEDGIRCYNEGASVHFGERKTKNIEVINCTVNKMRSGVTIGFCDGKKEVRGCVSIGSENGYWVGSDGIVTESAGSAENGPLLNSYYSNDKNSTYELTVINNHENPINKVLAYVAGSKHKLIFNSDKRVSESQQKIKISGYKELLRFQKSPKYDNLPAQRVMLVNNTAAAVKCGERSAESTISSLLKVDDEGERNEVKKLDLSYVGGFSVVTDVQAEHYTDSAKSGLKHKSLGKQECVIIESNKQWLKYENFYFGANPKILELKAVMVGVGKLECRLGKPDGKLIGELNFDEIPHSPHHFKKYTVSVGEVTGQHDLFFIFKGGNTANTKIKAGVALDSFKFGYWTAAEISLLER